ncbi:MAG TPA: YCF48-related protein, partial [Candidatus Binatia bacterium]|nr:YCF48-related protein [Candidatus Binatia bacterium]
MGKLGWSVWSAAVLLAAVGCHREEQEAPLFERKISIADKFYDVRALDAKKTVVVGYAGKILITEDAGNSWTVRPSGTDRAIYSLDFVDAQHAWACGQDGLILHTSDGGATWERQSSGTNVYLF